MSIDSWPQPDPVIVQDGLGCRLLLAHLDGDENGVRELIDNAPGVAAAALLGLAVELARVVAPAADFSDSAPVVAAILREPAPAAVALLGIVVHLARAVHGSDERIRQKAMITIMQGELYAATPADFGAATDT